MVSIFVFASLPVYAATDKTSKGFEISKEMREKHVNELKEMIKHNKTEKNIKVTSSALKDGKEVNLPVKVAAKKVGTFTNNSGDEIGVYTALASTDYFNQKIDKSYSGITQYHHMYWYETESSDDVYISFEKQYAWWERTSTNYSVKNAYLYGCHEGRNLNGGGFIADAESYTIGTPTFPSSNGGLTTYKYSQTFNKNIYTPKIGDTYGSYIRSDIYQGSTKIYSNFYTRCSF